MNLATFEALLTAVGREALSAAQALAPTDSTLLACITRLQKQFPAELARGAVETVQLRHKARDKFERADAMFFTRPALEQASSETVARHRAKRFAGLGRVGDFCCGIGGDAIALAERGQVVAIDNDPLCLAMAAANLDAYNVRDRVGFVESDVLRVPLPELAGVFFDPDRRPGGRRHVRLAGYEPRLDAVRERFPRGFPLGVKVAPAVPWADLEGLDAEVEFISLGGELKECALWFGPLRSIGRRATILPGGHTMHAEHPAPRPEVCAPREFLYDPDPALVRSGLITDLAAQLGAYFIDPEIAFLTTRALTPTPFARAYSIVESLPFQRKRLAKRLRALDVGRVTFVKRGAAIDVEELNLQLKLRGTQHGCVILTLVGRRPIAMIAEPLQAL